MTTRETIAAIQHDIWAHWMRYLFSVSQANDDDSVTIPRDKAIRWKRQLATHYWNLSEGEKESDREQADKVLAALPRWTQITNDPKTLPPDGVYFVLYAPDPEPYEMPLWVPYGFDRLGFSGAYWFPIIPPHST